MSLIDLKTHNSQTHNSQTHNSQSHNSQIYNFKTYIANQLLHKKLHFKCSCIISFDIIGEIVDYEIKNNEIVFLVNSNNKIVKIGENTPNLDVNEL